jgi:hypothetical protein
MKKNIIQDRLKYSVVFNSCTDEFGTDQSNLAGYRFPLVRKQVTPYRGSVQKRGPYDEVDEVEVGDGQVVADAEKCQRAEVAHDLHTTRKKNTQEHCSSELLSERKKGKDILTTQIVFRKK